MIAEQHPRVSGSSDRVALALEAGQLGTWRWDVTTGELEWDTPLERVFGIEPGSFAGTFAAYLELLHPDDRASALAVIERSLATGEPHYVEHRVVLPDGTTRWISGTGRVVRDGAGELVAMVGVGADITARKLAELRLAFLARAGQLLGSSLDLDVTLQQLCDLSIEQLADWCSVDLLEDGHVRLVAVSHRNPEKVAYARRLRERFGVDLDDEQGLPKVLRTGQPEVLPEIDEQLIRAALAQLDELSEAEVDEFVALGLRSSMVIPLIGAGGDVLGAISLVSAESGRVYDDQDVALAQEIARRAGTAVENATLYSRVEHAAVTLQRSLLPPQLPDLEFAELAAHYAPLGGRELIGGDFYDAFPISDGRRWCLVMGDVSGKGIDAAALTGAARWTLRSSLARTGSPTTAIAELNDTLLQQDWRGRFLTVCATILEPQAEGVRVLYACGGHPPPILVRRDSVDVLPGSGMIVGILPTVVPTGEQAWLRPGDSLVLYSDGFSEVRRNGDLFGEAAMLHALRDLPPERTSRQVVDGLVAAATAFGPQRDDMALLVVTVGPATRRSSGLAGERSARTDDRDVARQGR